MKKILTTIIALTTIFTISNAQDYNDYIGAGHAQGITITASHQAEGSEAINTINGNGLDSRRFETGRFLSQATMGANEELISTVMEMDFGDWIDQQIAVTPSYHRPVLDEVWLECLDTIAVHGFVDPEEVFGPAMTHFSYSWSHINMTANDLLRQKVAFALSQILVVSSNSDLGGEAQGMAHFYDIFVENAFGNYKDILKEVTLHVAMGYYLSHLNNPKANPLENVHPDENYAREIMQLFSIGLYELNSDGSHQLDAEGNSIPTYDNTDIKEMAKIFTGLGPGGINENVTWTDEPYFGLDIWGADFTVPLTMYEEWHETGQKVVLKNDIIPANQPGMDDIDDAINVLFNHHNVGPFIGLRLIQRLVKSNPTPAYIERVSSVFSDNGNGVRGDMTAVFKAILMDDEARDGSYMFESHASRLREPLMRHIGIARALELVPDRDGRYWLNYDYADELKQQALNAPSVFNFYPPDHKPVGDISSQGYVSPEFKIHNTATAINYFNNAYRWTRSWGEIIGNSEGYWDPNYDNGPGENPGKWYDYGIDDIEIDIEAYRHLAAEPELLINALDKLLTHGQLSDELRGYLRENLPNIQWTGGDWEANRIRTAIYLIVTSPDFAVIR